MYISYFPMVTLTYYYWFPDENAVKFYLFVSCRPLDMRCFSIIMSSLTHSEKDIINCANKNVKKEHTTLQFHCWSLSLSVHWYSVPVIVRIRQIFQALTLHSSVLCNMHSLLIIAYIKWSDIFLYFAYFWLAGTCFLWQCYFTSNSHQWSLLDFAHNKQEIYV